MPYFVKDTVMPLTPDDTNLLDPSKLVACTVDGAKLPDGAANVPSPLRNVVVLFGGVGTAPPAVAVMVAMYAGAIAVPCQTPVPIVPTDTREDSVVTEFSTTAPAVPMLIARAVATPVPNPVTPERATEPALPDTEVWSPVLEPEIEEVPVTASVGVDEPEMTTEFTEMGDIAPAVMVMAGVVVALATVPEKPFAVATDTVVTVPLPNAFSPSTPLLSYRA
jgi:hypothetical protein